MLSQAFFFASGEPINQNFLMKKRVQTLKFFKDKKKDFISFFARSLAKSLDNETRHSLLFTPNNY